MTTTQAGRTQLDIDASDQCCVDEFDVGGTPFEELTDWDVAPVRQVRRPVFGEFPDETNLTLLGMAESVSLHVKTTSRGAKRGGRTRHHVSSISWRNPGR